MVGAGHPERIEALHALHPNQDVLQRVVERVAQVQSAGHVGRRDHNRVRRATRIGLGMKMPRLLPLLIDPLLGLSMIETIWKRVGRKCSRHCQVDLSSPVFKVDQVHHSHTTRLTLTPLTGSLVRQWRAG